MLHEMVTPTPREQNKIDHNQSNAPPAGAFCVAESILPPWVCSKHFVLCRRSLILVIP